MSKPDSQSTPEFFNNSTLSDVIIKQIYKGETREYFAHKAVLCMNSRYFLRAFTGNFKESMSNAIELHDDKPDDFGALLKSIYTIDHNANTFGDLALANDTNFVLSLVGLYVIADKYDVTRISAAVMKAVPRALHEATDEAITAAIKAYYNSTALVGSKMGTAIAWKVHTQNPKLMSTTEFEELVRSYPTFGADVALAMMRKPEPKRIRLCLGDYHHENVVTEEMCESVQKVFYCNWCSATWWK